MSDCNSPGDIERGPNKAIRVVCASCGFAGPWFGGEPILNSNPHAKIATLRAENARLRKALEKIINGPFDTRDGATPLARVMGLANQVTAIARAALAAKEPSHG